MSESPRETARAHWRCLASRFAANWRAWHLTGSALENGPRSLEVPGILSGRTLGNGPRQSRKRLTGTLQRQLKTQNSKLKTDFRFGSRR